MGLAAGAVAALMAGVPAEAQKAPRGPALPPVVVQPAEPTARPPAAQSTRTGNAPRRTVRRAPPAAIATPVAARPSVDSDNVSQTRDGVDGYVAHGTAAGAKVATPLLQLPRSVSTITRQEMADRDVESVREAMQYTAGVGTYFREGQFTRDYGYVRGFQGLQFVDGLRLNVNNYGLEPYGFERVDVLKGPAASLYGQGSPGGLWDLTSKRPTDHAFGEALVRFGVRNTVEGAFDVGGPVTPDQSLLYRVVGLGKMGDGQIDFTSNQRAFIAPSFTWRISEDTTLTILAAYQYDPKLTVLQPLPYVGTIVPGANGQFISRSTFLGEPGYHDTSIKQARVGYEFKHRLNDVFSFQQNFYYQNIDIDLKEVMSSASSSTTTNRLAYHQTFKIDMYQIDNRLKADFAMGPLWHHVVFGTDYSAVTAEQGTGTGAATALNLYTPVYGQPFVNSPTITSLRYQDQRQAGAYVQDRVEFDRLNVLLGVRYDQLEQDQKTRALNVATGVFSNPAWTFQPDHGMTYNGGLIYNFENGVAPYASYSQTFTPTFGTDFFGRPFVPVTGDQKEFGIKYIPPGFDILMSAAVFDITQYNVQTRDLAHPGFSVQTSSVESQGGEVELKTTHLYGFNISAAYTYLDAKVIATNTPGGLGKRPVGIPMNAASLWTTYRFGGGGWLAGLTLGGGVRWVGDQAVDALNTLAVPSFTLYDLTARYDLGERFPTLEKWDVALNVKNLLDTRYVGSCDDALNCYYGPGRNITGTLRARW
ncbi:TonB-dependent siderophore receptor [Bradyrhizobium diversitatis]|uniref:TonB-dependent siderophore receptor n=1 Tax=Bradyrhizobium diversitatis TaxID=2755406 RepID=A0ABS0P5L1_9BRAD|nr:TonB-dependent siderophore receptor [Bradyrhizobium diversitatis]MBH5388588.1 TonB-dependent siderophore receptor [Bradyrhizobium diversitatis]